MNERLLTVREVAERLRSAPETVRRWLRQGKLRGFRPGGTKLGYRIPESELERFLRSAEGEGSAPTRGDGTN
jgi:excisionase family DNA binding protein